MLTITNRKLIFSHPSKQEYSDLKMHYAARVAEIYFSNKHHNFLFAFKLVFQPLEQCLY